MATPKSYLIQTPDPLAGFTSGLQFGADIQQIQAGTELAKQKARQAEILAERGVSLQGYIDKIQAGTATAADYQNASILANKDQAENIRKAFEARSAQENQASLTETSKIVSAFKANAPSLGIQMMEDRALALSNAGKVSEAAFMDNLVELAKESPKQVGDYLASQMTLIPGGTDMLDNVLKLTEEQRAQAAEGREAELHPIEVKQLQADLGLTDAQVEETKKRTKKLGAEIQKLAMEIESIGDPDPEQLFDMETKLNQKYVDRTKAFSESKSHFSKLKASADDDTGAGDVAMIFSFMKMLDPGSVVRESEFAIAENTAGLFGRLETIYPKLLEGERLTDSQRKNFVRLADLYMESTEDLEKTVRSDLQRFVDSYNLNPTNVFGGAERRAAATTARRKTEAEQAARDVTTMSDDDLFTSVEAILGKTE